MSSSSILPTHRSSHSYPSNQQSLRAALQRRHVAAAVRPSTPVREVIDVAEDDNARHAPTSPFLPREADADYVDVLLPRGNGSEVDAHAPDPNDLREARGEPIVIPPSHAFGVCTEETAANKALVENMTCAACYHPAVVDPVQLDCKKHILCMRCLVLYVAAERRRLGRDFNDRAVVCPHRCSATTALASDLTKMASPLLQTAVATLDCFCPHEGCTTKYKLGINAINEATHMQECAFREWTCIYAGCGAKMKRGPDGRTVKEHIRACVYNVAPCAHTSRGCDQHLQRTALDKHEPTCAFRLVTCDHCEDEVLARDFDAHTKQGAEGQPCAGFVPCPNGCISAHLNKKSKTEKDPSGDDDDDDDDDDADRVCYIPKRLVEVHLKTCPNRIDRCHLCDMDVPRKQWKKHTRDKASQHVINTGRMIAALENRVKMLEKASRSPPSVAASSYNRVWETVVTMYTGLWTSDAMNEPREVECFPGMTLTIQTKNVRAAGCLSVDLRQKALGRGEAIPARFLQLQVKQLGTASLMEATIGATNFCPDKILYESPRYPIQMPSHPVTRKLDLFEIHSTMKLYDQRGHPIADAFDNNDEICLQFELYERV